MIVLLVLGAFVCTGLAEKRYDVGYGDSLNLQVPRKPKSFEFTRKFSSNVTILWKWGEPLTSLDGRRKYTGIFFEMYNLTQKDMGHYRFRGKEQNELSTYTIEVKAKTKSFQKSPGKHLRFSAKLEPNFCNVYFFPEGKLRRRMSEVVIVRRGKLQRHLDELGLVGFDLNEPCGIYIEAIQNTYRGRYEIRDENNDTALEVYLQVADPTIRTSELKAGAQLSFNFDLEPNDCNIHFFGEPSFDIVRHGKLQNLYENDCIGFELIKPCGILKEDLQMSCQGRYEIRDQDGDTALVMILEMEAPSAEHSAIVSSMGVFFSSLFVCVVMRCCCKGSSSKNKTSEPEAAEPDVPYEEYDLAPRALWDPLPRSSSSPTDPLIHNHPSEAMPPTYSEIFGSGQTDAPTFPVHSDPEPRFEVNRMTFPSAPPLSSDSTISDVYTSGKLNFL
ncbi:Glutamate 5-kinase [Dissostichus eleginoides]|uniref:Glutamate 5-kinase n=1 Tax=Dissostichus eleginoides TaxID=100907 RepID=A0AAD9CLS1_DISEL|nr:Glutamate 5-kinase [Dissostichus eleginoides]